MSMPNYCRICGTRIKPGSRFCPHCGKEVTVIVRRGPPSYPSYREQPYQAPRYSPPASPQISPPSDRPTSIAFAAILFALVGVLTVVGGLLLLALSGVASEIPYIGDLFSGFFSFIGILILASGALRLLCSIWLWNLQVKGGVLAIIIVVLSLLLSGAGLLFGNVLAIIDLLLDLVVLTLVAIGWHSLK
jgi:zinc-ribbon domain